MTAPAITFTLDLEDHRPDDRVELRFPAMARLILDRMADRGVRATVFIVGEVGSSHPELVAEVAAAGHEVGLHAWRHVPLTEVDPARFRRETARGRALLEDVAGTAVVGFRAPTYSLVPESAWVTDVLSDLGFAYSSSVLPAHNPLFGYPGAPRRPFRWPSGLTELPSPVTGVGRWQVPYLGGVYLRALPWPVVRGAAALERSTPVPFTYVHPYDPDVAEAFWWVPEAGRLSPLLWLGRSTTLDRLDRLAGGAGGPLVERLAELGELPTFDPLSGSISDQPAVPPDSAARDLTPRPAAGGRSRRSRSRPGAADVPQPTPTERPGTAAPSGADRGDQFAQDLMVHRLPDAELVERIPWLTRRAAGRRVVHVGFVDAGCQDLQARSGTWLHGHLATTATSLVGLDLDEDGVAAATRAGFEAHVADCRDPAQLAALELEPAELVIAGEVIEHLDDPGSFLDGLRALVAADGALVITTPNAYGLLNVFASLAGREINHPDHVVMFTWRTLSTLLARHGWQVVRTCTYVPTVKALDRSSAATVAMGLAGRAVVGLERAMGRTINPFAADGLILEARPGV